MINLENVERQIPSIEFLAGQFDDKEDCDKLINFLRSVKGLINEVVTPQINSDEDFRIRRRSILKALIGDTSDLGIRDFSLEEKLFILNNPAMEKEVVSLLNDFADGVTPNNKAWLDKVMYGSFDELQEELNSQEIKNKKELEGFISGLSEDKVNNPSHYNKGEIECIDAIAAALTLDELKGFVRGNVIKYLWRVEHKGGLEDLKKARWYLDYLISKLS